MKRFLCYTEWYPVYSLRVDGGTESREFTEEELADLARVEREFQVWQHKLVERFEPKK
jgi:hypothetical protein